MIKTYIPKFIGSWYNTNYLEHVKLFLFDSPKENAKAIIVPHAGYNYSGHVLADVYSRINFKNINKIILLCTFHKNLKGLILPSFSKINFSNPDIELSIDTDSINFLSKHPEFKLDDNNYYNHEHSFEMQLPFIIATATKNIKLVPILVGRSNDFNNIAEKLIELIDENTLIIVSSDFIHYGPNYDYVNKNIKSAKKYILDNDFINFKSIIDNDITNFVGNSVCGRNAIILLMHISNEFNLNSKLVSYETSADNVDDRFNLNSVSYAGFIFAGGIKKNNLQKMYDIKKFYIDLDSQYRQKNKINLIKLLDGKLSFVPRFILILLSKIYSASGNITSFSIQEIHNSIVNHLIIESDKKPKKYNISVIFNDLNKLQGYAGLVNNNLTLLETIIMCTLKVIFGDEIHHTRLNTSIKYYKYLYTSDSYNFKTKLEIF